MTSQQEKDFKLLETFCCALAREVVKDKAEIISALPEQSQKALKDSKSLLELLGVVTQLEQLAEGIRNRWNKDDQGENFQVWAQGAEDCLNYFMKSVKSTMDMSGGTRYCLSVPDGATYILAALYTIERPLEEPLLQLFYQNPLEELRNILALAEVANVQ